jgi:hypothetical protein
MQLELFVIFRKLAIFHRKLSDNKEYTGRFKVFISQTVCSQQLRPTHLKPDWIDAVVNHAALVGFRIPRDDCYRMVLNAYSPWKIHILISGTQELKRSIRLLNTT